MITTLTKEQFDFLKQMALVVPINETESYYHLPFWFRNVGENHFQVLKMNQVPDENKEALDFFLNEIKEADKFFEEQ